MLTKREREISARQEWEDSGKGGGGAVGLSLYDGNLMPLAS